MKYLWLILLSAVGMLVYAQQLPIGAIQAAPERYSDVPETHWAYEALTQATALGILTGYPDGTFGGRNTLTRYEAAIIAARLLNYTDSLINTLSGDPEFVENLREASETLGNLASAEARIQALERAMEQAASLAYARSLEARIVELERIINEYVIADIPGEAPLPGTMTDPDSLPLSAAEAAAEDNGGTTSLTITAVDEPAEQGNGNESPLPGLTLAAQPAFPFYVGFSPGIISTSGTIYVAAQLGYDGLIGPVGVTVRLGLNSSLEEIRLSAGPTVRVQVFDDNLNLTAGLGVGVSFRPEAPALLLELPVGAEYLITPQVGVFGQVTTSYAFNPVNKVDAQISTGFNLRF
jgi:hypothetical protein